jgi:predicted permease
MASFWQSLRYTVRVLSKSPGFTGVAILSLALGIGANTAIFTLINALILRDIPVRQPERLVELSAVRQNGQVPFSYPMFQEVERGQRVFAGMMGWGSAGTFNIEVDGALSQSRVLTVTGEFYSELGVAPLLGRLLAPEDSNPSSGTTSQVVVISYECWQNRFGGALNIVGKGIRVEGLPFTIIGVTRKWFTALSVGEPPEVTIPITAIPLLQDRAFSLDNRALLWLFATGRLRDGVTIEQARAQLQSFWPEVLLATASTETPGLRRQAFLSMGLDVLSAAKGARSDLRAQFTRPLYVLAGIVGLILLVACVNLANLMLARAAARSHEMSVRVALGASRWSIARQVFAESLALALSGALLGLGLAYWGSRLLVVLMTQGNLFPVTLDLSPDLRVLSLTVSVSILTGILFGLAPAWRCSREDPAAALQQNSRSLSAGTGKLSQALIVTQVALSLVLLMGAGLFVRSFERLRSIDLGFDRASLLEVGLNPRPGGYQTLDMNSYHQQLIEGVASLPGVDSVSFSTSSIPNSGAWHDTVSATTADPTTGTHLMTNAATVSPDFFRTLGIPLLRGREFLQSDDERHPHFAIVNRSLAYRLFPGGEAIGKIVRYGVLPDFQNVEIIGVVDNARIFGFREGNTPSIFFCSRQYPTEWGYLIVRTRNAPEALSKTVGHEIESLGHEYPGVTRTISEVLGAELIEDRATAVLSGFFAALALLLACIGVYGLMSYAVTRRTREIGVRVALGAQRGNIRWIVLRDTLALALLGIAIGIPSALAATRLIASMLFGLGPGDLPTIAGVSLLLLLVALFAGYLPARRASGIDPIEALRAE